jgi:hypothetical protein
MSRPLLFVALIALVHFLSSCCCWAVDKEVWEEVSHNVRIMRHRDGTSTEYRRSSDEKTLTKRRLSGTKGGRNATVTTTVYRMDSRGNPLSCKIFDGKGNELYKVAYGYHRETGRLVAEDMFDSRVPQKDPTTGKETPVRRMYWFYDGAGNVSRAFSFVWRKGEYAEEKYSKPADIESSFPTDNPFNNSPAAGTPGAPSSPNSGAQDDFDVPPPLPPLPFER